MADLRRTPRGLTLALTCAAFLALGGAGCGGPTTTTQDLAMSSGDALLTQKDFAAADLTGGPGDLNNTINDLTASGDAPIAGDLSLTGGDLLPPVDGGASADLTPPSDMTRTCTTASECGTATTCLSFACTSGSCVTSLASATTVCTEGGGELCDGAGRCLPTLMVVRVGTGSAALTTSSTETFLEHRSGTGALIGSALALPVAVSGANQPLTLRGDSTSEGGLALTTDGKFLLLAGYGTPPGTANIGASMTSTVNRVVARITPSGTIDTTTRFTSAFTAGSVRAAASPDGLSIWASGSTTGIQHITFATSGGTVVAAAPANTRNVAIFGGQLYGSSGASGNTNVFSVGTNLPTTAATVTALPGMSTTGANPYAFAFFDRNNTVAGLDTLYVADDRAPASGGLQKWTFDGATWTLARTFNTGLTVGLKGMTAFVSGTDVVVYATTGIPSNGGPGNEIVRLVDDGTSTPAFTSIATAAANTAYRGIALPAR